MKENISELKLPKSYIHLSAYLSYCIGSFIKLIYFIMENNCYPGTFFVLITRGGFYSF